ncbi:MAG TPA: DUF1580 domain-containing protein [Phycisphaerales bacterium]|nr:DUF1580 domain-containing protein [Phycisphaerales bacterium]
MFQQDSIGKATDGSDEAPAAEEHITLSQAAKLAPGRPSPNCVWRWCREGVRAASGKRVRLKHVRFGSRIYTTRQWLAAFGLALAEADAAHFERNEQPQDRDDGQSPLRRARRSRRKATDEARLRHIQAERELEEAGL